MSNSSSRAALKQVLGKFSDINESKREEENKTDDVKTRNSAHIDEFCKNQNASWVLVFILQTN
jgi:hypothetical protein